MYFDRKCKITFICHGATIYSDEFRVSDNEVYPPLNDAGQEEIDRICEFLKRRGVKNDIIYSSSAARTVQSAKLISKIYKQDFEIIEDLKPRMCGEWNGLTFDQIESQHPEMLDKLIKFPNEKQYQELVGERLSDVMEFLSECQKAGKDIIIRHVVVPGLTDSKESVADVVRIAKSVCNPVKIELLPFRKLCVEKYRKCGLKFPLENTPECDESLIAGLRKAVEEEMAKES